MQKIIVEIVKTHPDVIIPEYQTSLSAGCDVRAYLADKTKFPDGKLYLERGVTVLIPTGLKFSVPDGYEMQIRPRSGLSSKTKVRIANSPGTLDADYRGELMVILENIDTPVYNDGDNLFSGTVIITHQDRIAQLIFAPVYQASFLIKESLEETIRGEGGFGSTGNK